MKITEKNIIGEVVAEDYRMAEVFTKFGIDYCCGGNRSIGEACLKKEIPNREILEELNDVRLRLELPAIQYTAWPLDLMADYIEKKHHRYVTEKTPVLQDLLGRICQLHGRRHPEVLLITEDFNNCASMLAEHMQKEENILFPYIRTLVLSQEPDQPESYGKGVESPIEMMKDDHEVEGERFVRIAALSNNYNPPADACDTFKATYALLKEFEDDLRLHIHLENNILFPKALQMTSYASSDTGKTASNNYN